MDVHVVIIDVAGKDGVDSKIDVVVCDEFHFVVVPYFDARRLDFHLSCKFVIGVFVNTHGPGDVLGGVFAIS